MRPLIHTAIYGAIFSGLAAVPAAPLLAGGYFTDVAAEAGLDFVHFNGMSGEFYFPEMTGAGAGVLDFDGDGDLDVYLVQGTAIGPGKTVKDALFPFQGTPPPRDRLFRNQLIEKGKLGFVDATAESGLDAQGYGMGVAAGDVDNDGDVDVYVLNYGPNQLWRNDGGTFTDVTDAATTGDPRWSTSGAFVDLDGDGWLDLYVANYVRFDEKANPKCYHASSRRDYCGPLAYEPENDRLLHNLGPGADGRPRFEDVTTKWLGGYQPGAGLGVITGDFDGDGRIDLYVANDGTANQLWMRHGAEGPFQDEALLAGVAVNRRGSPEASMGVDAADVDGDGDEDLISAHLMGETNTLYVNLGGGLFDDRSVESGLGQPSFAMTAFGTAWTDFDNDGRPDLLTVAGAVKILEDRVAAGDPYPLDQRNQLYRNLGPGPGGEVRFEEVSDRAGAVFALEEVSRGAAVGDVDDDGDEDVVVANNSGPARLLRNDVGQDAPWLGLRLVGTAGGRDMLGARVELRRAGASALVRRVRTDGSYASARDPRLVFGLGGGSAVEGIVVTWPDGTRETFAKVPLRAYTTLRQGSGETAP